MRGRIYTTKPVEVGRGSSVRGEEKETANGLRKVYNNERREEKKVEAIRGGVERPDMVRIRRKKYMRSSMGGETEVKEPIQEKGSRPE